MTRYKIYEYKDLKGVIKEGDYVRAVKGKNNEFYKLKNDGSNTQKITEVEDARIWIAGCYHWLDSGYFLEIVDPNELKKAITSSWNTRFESSDGIIVEKESITIDGQKKTPSQWKELSGKISSALKKLKSL